MNSGRVPAPARVLCAALAGVAGWAAVRVVVTGELAARGGVAVLSTAGVVAVAGLLGVLAAGAAWVAATGRGA